MISLPRKSVQLLGLQEDSEVNISVDQDGQRIFIERAGTKLGDIDPSFAQQLNDFIEQYRPALEALSK